MKRIIASTLCLALMFYAAGCGNTVKNSDNFDEPAGISVAADTKVSYLGPEGTYTEEAAQFFFDGAGILLPKETVADAICDVTKGASQYAVIPQENTMGGAVTDYIDALLAEDDIYVVGEVILPINQTLLGIPGASIEDIQKVCSHAQGLKQTENWRKEYLPDVVTEEMASTAAAASYVAKQKDKSIAAIAAPGAAELYGLSVLAEKIQLSDANKTRFYVLSDAPLPEGSSKRAVFAAECEANRLEDIILSMHNAGLKLVTIHDRPEGSTLGNYRYIIETESDSSVTKKQIDEVARINEIRFLGSFQMIEKTEQNKNADAAASASEDQKAAETEEQDILKFVDVYGEEYETVIDPAVPKHDYNKDCFTTNGSFLTYEDESYTSRIGIDVSKHQENISWTEVKEQGIEFAFIRIGYRGYGEEGSINLDERFYENIKGAEAAGIDVGVYFFSQAINEEEALEEAGFVADRLEGYELQLPVVYDPETITDDDARTDSVSGEQFTRNAIVFCDTIREKGYEPMIYSNMLWEAFELDLSQLSGIPVWYADYEAFPQTPYNFAIWQYTNEGQVNGIDGLVDMNIQMIEK